MLKILLGFFIAALIGISASAYYGAENLSQHIWVEQLIWAVIIASVVNEAICAIFSSHLCGRMKWLRLVVCHSSRCTQA